MGSSHPGWRRTQGAANVKEWEDKQDLMHIPDTFTQNKNENSAVPLIPQQLNPDYPHPITSKYKKSNFCNNFKLLKLIKIYFCHYVC